MRYNITSVHTAGESVGHPCSEGTYEDPTDEFEDIVEADSPQAAEAIGAAMMADLVESWPICDCPRHETPGTESWWNSMAIRVIPLVGGGDTAS